MHRNTPVITMSCVMSTMPGMALPATRRRTTSATVSSAQAIRITTPIHAQMRQQPNSSDSNRVGTPAGAGIPAGAVNGGKRPARSGLLHLRDFALHGDVDVACVGDALLLEILHRLVEQLREPLVPLAALLVA